MISWKMMNFTTISILLLRLTLIPICLPVKMSQVNISFIIRILLNFFSLAFRKKSLESQPAIAKNINLSISNQPPGLKSPIIPAIVNRPIAPTVSVNPITPKDVFEPASKVLSPPPMMQPPPMNKISGPSFASALGAATAQSGTSVSTSTSHLPSAQGSTKQFNSGAFEELESIFVKKFPTKGLDENVSKFLAASYQNLPDNYELERNRQYCPKQPYAMPSYYQSEPPQILSNPSIFERFDLDTLFFIFYYQQKTYPQ